MSAELPPARVVVDKRAPVLAAPPRRVSPQLWIHIVFGGRVALAAWAWLALVAFAELAVFGTTGFASRYHFSAKTEGVVREVAIASMNDDNEATVYRIDYTFDDRDGHHVESRAYSAHAPERNSRVTVEYDPDHPSASWLPGWGSRFRSSLQNTIVLLLGLPALGLLVLCAIGSRRELRLLRRGRETTGKLVGKRIISSDDSKDTTELTFEYVAGDTPRRISVRTMQPGPLEDEAEERLIYDVADPRRAVMLDALPGGARVVDGQLRAHQVTAMLKLRLACVAVLIAGLGVYVYVNLA